jgi:NADH dehydrogenase
VTLGLVPNPILTRDQVRALHVPMTVTAGAMGLAELGISPTPMEAVLPEYLWRYRPSGQYAAIKASAKNLRV